MLRKIFSRQRGHALLELIIVAPVMLSIAALGIEVSRFLRLNQVASILSQESANNAFKRCSDILSFDLAGDTFSSQKTQIDIQKCLLREISNFSKAASTLYPQAQSSNPRFNLLLSVYRLDSDTSTTVGFQQLTRIFVSSLILNSRYSISAGNIVRSGLPVLQNNDIRKIGRVVIAEVTFQYTPIVPLYKIFLNLNILDTSLGQFRETTII